ncbi:hypothetical protein JCM10908_004131 [Rhodotorula pacifica]|uniref:uncharacterized protein n=1 Tax=Rhodotorula pacifica TaxID=1495444 RepID=UPI0031781FC9
MRRPLQLAAAGCCVLAYFSSSSIAAPVDVEASDTALAVTSSASLRSFAVDPNLPPTRDPFHQLPDQLALYQNGAIVRSRAVNTSFATVTAGSAQLFYRTTDALGDPSATVTTLFAPKTPATPPRIMVLMAPIDSACPDCQIAYALQSGSGSNATTLLPSVATDIVASLSKGWYVSVPDHEGPKAAFISGVTAALCGIDALRASLNFTDMIPNSQGYKAVYHGYSGGAAAASWSTQFLSSSYGQGLNVVGASFGGTPVSLLPTLELLSGGPASFLATSALAGLGNQYPELESWHQQNLNAAGKQAFQLARSQCAEGLGALNNINVFEYFTDGVAALSAAIPQKYVQLEQLGVPLDTTQAPVTTDGVMSVPVFIYHSASDGTVSYQPVPGYVASQCARGARLTFANTTGTAHSATYIAFEGDVYAFLEQAFEGTLPSSGCTNQQGIENALGSAAYIRNIGLAAWTLLASAGATSRRRSYGW